MRVSLADREVRAQQRAHDVHQLRVLKHLLRSPVELAKLRDELLLGQVVLRRVGVCELRRAAARDVQAERERPPAPSQLARKLERDERAHAVAEEGEGLIEMRLYVVAQRLDERAAVVVR